MRRPWVYGQLVVFTASVSSGSGPPPGSVQFQIDGTDFGTPVVLDNGTAHVSTATLSAGTHSVTATYPSDGPNFLGSTPLSPLSLLVAPATLTVTADSTSRTYGDANPALTASYSGFQNGDTA